MLKESRERELIEDLNIKQTKSWVFILRIVVLFSSISIITSLFFVNVTSAAVYLEYNKAKTDGGTTGILYVYQPVQGAPSQAGQTNMKWARTKLFQYVGGGGSWDNNANAVLNIASTSNFQAREQWVWTNGNDGVWSNDSKEGYTVKMYDPTATYTAYSAYGTTTLTQDADILLLGYWYSGAVNGTIRVKINDSIQSNVGNLDASGQFYMNTSPLVFGKANNVGTSTAVFSIAIGQNVRRGDVVKIEVVGYNSSGYDRAYIAGIRYANYQDINPGDLNWGTTDTNQIENQGTSVTIAATMRPKGDSGSFNGFVPGPAHPNHENGGSITSIDIDGTSYTMDGNLNVGDVVHGNQITIAESNNLYGTASPTDDFADITRTFQWTDSFFKRGYQLSFKNQGATSTSFYIGALSPEINSAPTSTEFRYYGIDSNTKILQPSDGSLPGAVIGTPTDTSSHLDYFGGNINLKVSLDFTDTAEGYQSNGSNKLYLLKNTYQNKFWNPGDTVSGTSTITYTYETPADIDWVGKTLIIAKTDTINDSVALLPFISTQNYIKFIPNKGLTFSGVAPIKTFFTSIKDWSIGNGILAYPISGLPAKGDWTGITVTGAVDTLNNVINYSASGLVLSSNANAYNNTLYGNTTSINAASGSNVKNNVISTTTISTTGAGVFDFNLYDSNLETNGKDEDVYFPGLVSSDFSIVSTSTAIDSGTSISLIGDFLDNPIYGTPDIGAVEYQPPFTLGTHKLDSTGNIRIYGDRKYRYTTATSSSMTVDLNIAPGETWTYSASTTRPEWLNISNITWTDSLKSWTVSSTNATTTVYTIGDLTSNEYYLVKVDSLVSSSITGTTCTNGVCRADSTGHITFTYTGGYSTHTFTVEHTSAPVSPISSSSGSTPMNRVSNLLSMGKKDEAKKVAKQYNLKIISSSTTTATTTYPFKRTLRLGMTGDDVKALQQYLNTHGFTVSLTGPGSLGNETTFFGALTKKALIKFQEANAPYILTPLGLKYGTGLFGEGTRGFVLKSE
jgi:hypothetical protein